MLSRVINGAPANPARNLTGAGLGRISENGQISNLPEPKSGTTHINIRVGAQSTLGGGFNEDILPENYV